ncbi:MAG: hypothetical protein RQ723_07460 [Desulfuromonadales bacterium]|nr:hypothetical protein [Desulfuromonadales bacterium]
MIIGIAGKAASGKTTAARHMLERLDRETVIVPMAAVLRDEVERFLCRIGAEASVPLLYGSQQDKVTVFYVDAARATAECARWADFVEVNRDIQGRPGQTAATTRRILQWWGTEYRRAADPDYWTKAWGRKIEGLDLAALHLLVDDVRFVNELQVVRAHGGLLLKVERPGFNGANDHSSENSLDHVRDWDALIVNDGSLEEFLGKVEQTFSALVRF